MPGSPHDDANQRGPGEHDLRRAHRVRSRRPRKRRGPRHPRDEDLIVRFEIEVDSLTGEDFIEISPTDARHYAGIIDSVLDNDGDARAEQGALTNLRDVLQGRPA